MKKVVFRQPYPLLKPLIKQKETERTSDFVDKMNALMDVAERSGETFLTPAMQKWACKEIYDKKHDETKHKGLDQKDKDKIINLHYLSDEHLRILSRSVAKENEKRQKSS